MYAGAPNRDSDRHRVGSFLTHTRSTTMNKSTLNALAVSIGFAFSIGASAAALSSADYKSARDRIAAEYKSDRAACAAMSSEARSRCYSDAKSRQKAARAELDAD